MLKKQLVKKYNLTANNISVINRGIDTKYFNQPFDSKQRNQVLKHIPD